MLVKKVCARVIGAQPIFVQQKIMNLVRVDQLFKIYVVRAEPAYEIDRLRELNVSIIVAMNQQNR